jgi:hypothetical protein
VRDKDTFTQVAVLLPGGDQKNEGQDIIDIIFVSKTPAPTPSGSPSPSISATPSASPSSTPAPSSPQINVTFERSDTSGYSLIDFNTNVSSISTPPTGGTAGSLSAMKIVKGADGAAGTTFLKTNASGKTLISGVNKKVTMKVYSAVAGKKVMLKVEDALHPEKSVEAFATETTAVGWKTLTFDLGVQRTGTSAFNSAYTYNMASIFFDFLGITAGAIYYVDDIEFNGSGVPTPTPTPAVASPPPAPATPTGVAGNGQVALTITAPASTGGSAITRYAVTQSSTLAGTYAAVAAGTCTMITAAGTCTVTGLNNGTSYFFKVAAVNVVGTGSASVSSASITPVGDALTPIFSTPVATATGFTFNVTNYNAAYTFTPSMSAGTGTATPGTAVGSTLPIIVSGVTAGSATVQVATSRTGYTAGTATVSGNALPVISSVSTSSTTRGVAVVITGTNLWAATGVRIGSSTTAITKFTVISPTSIIFNTALAATGAVAVIAPAGTATGPSITVSAPLTAPGTVTMSPTTGGPGTAIILTGTNLGAATAVVRGTVSIPCRVLAINQILLAIPTGLATGTFTITTPGGVATSPSYTASATLATRSVTSAAQTIKRSTVATIEGTNLGAITSMTINGTAVTDYTVTIATSFSVRIPASATVGASTIVITTAGGTVSTSTVTIS